MHKVLFCFFVLGLFGVGGTVALSQRTVGEEPNRAQISPNLLPPGSERLLYRKLFYDAKRLTHARRDELERSLHSTEAAERRRQRLKQAYADLLGPLPEKSPLKAQVTGQIERKGYRIEKILYESQPGHHVTANLYLPTTGEPPYPGVLLACGHSENGKAYPAYQATAALMAKNGLATLCYDPISQGERIQLPGAPQYGTTTHTLLDLGALLVGRSTVWYELVDGMRSLDYLRSRAEVDPEKPIGLTGTSGGGTQTTFLMAADPRIGPAAPSCYLMTRLRKFETVGPADGCQWLPGEGARRIDHFDYCVMRADKPTLVLAARDDFLIFLPPEPPPMRRTAFTVPSGKKKTLTSLKPLHLMVFSGRIARRQPASCASGCSVLQHQSLKTCLSRSRMGISRSHKADSFSTTFLRKPPSPR